MTRLHRELFELESSDHWRSARLLLRQAPQDEDEEEEDDEEDEHGNDDEAGDDGYSE